MVSVYSMIISRWCSRCKFVLDSVVSHSGLCSIIKVVKQINRRINRCVLSLLRLKRTSPTAYCDCWEKCKCKALIAGKQGARFELLSQILTETGLVTLPNSRCVNYRCSHSSGMSHGLTWYWCCCQTISCLSMGLTVFRDSMKGHWWTLLVSSTQNQDFKNEIFSGTILPKLGNLASGRVVK